MPRIEYIPSDFDFDGDDGLPTFDVCVDCASDFEEGEPMPEFAQPGLDDAAGAEIGNADVCHPPFDKCDYVCECCGEALTKADG